MSIYRIATEDGSVYKIEAADDATEQEVSDYFNNEYLPSLETAKVNEPVAKDTTPVQEQQPQSIDNLKGEDVLKAIGGTPSQETGDFARGFQTAYKQLPQLGYGLEAGAAAAGESVFGEGGMLTEAKKEAVAKYEQAGKELEVTAKPTDSATYSFEKAQQGDYGSLVDTLQYGLGYGAGQLTQGGLASIGGKLVGKAVARATAENIAEKMVAEETAKWEAKVTAGTLTEEQLKSLGTQEVAKKMAEVGSKVALGSQAFGMEAGEIGGDLAKQSVDENRTLTTGEVVKGLGSAIAATALEYGADRFTLGALTGKGSLTDIGKYTEGLKGNLLRGTGLGLSSAGVEGGTEFAQTLIEEVGKDKDPFSSESFRQAIDAAALGSIGGGGIGAIGGALSPAQQKPDQPATGEIDPSMLSGGLPNSTTQTTAQQPDQTSSKWQETMGKIRGIVGENQLVDNETVAKDVMGAETIEDAIQVFNHVGEAISTDHVLNMEQASSFAQDLTKTDTEYLDNKDYQDAVQLENQLSTVRDELAYKKFQTAFEESNQQASRAEFNALVEQEINNKNQQLKDLIQYQSDERARKTEVEASVPSINKALEDAQWAKTRNNRNSVIQMVFDRNVPAENIFPAIKAELKRQGFKDTELSQDDIDSYNLLKAYDQNNPTIAKEPVSFGGQPVAARSASDIEFYNTGTNKVDKQGNIIADALGEQGANAGEQFTSGQGQDVVTNFVSPETPVRQESDALRKVDEWVRNGATYKNGMLFDSKGKKFVLNTVQREYYLNNRPAPIATTPVDIGEVGNAPRKRYMGVKQQGVNAGEQMTGSIGQDQISGVENEPVTVDLYRGVPKDASTEDTVATVGNALFMTPTEQIAKDYAGKEGGVSKSTHTFNNLLEAATWAEAKSKIGLTQADTMETLVNTAREQGYDGITFTSKFNGKEYIVLKPNETKTIKTGTIENPILKKNGSAFPSQQSAQTYIRTNPELSKDTHTWVKLGDEKYGIVTKDQVVKKPATNNLRAINGLEPIEMAIGKLGGINREMANRAGFSNFKGWYFTKTSSEGFDGMALQLADKGYDVDGENDLIAKLRESLDADFGTGKKVYTFQGIDNAIDKMAADRADQEEQEQDRLLNTYTNEELNAILDAKTQAEKDQLMKDFKAEKKRKADQEVDSVVDEMLGKGKTTTMDIFAPERKGKVAVGREVTVEGEQLANSGTKVRELYPNHWFYGDKGAQDKFNDTEIDYEGEYPNLESISLINTDSNIGGFYDQVEQAIYQTSQSDRTTLHELGHAVHHQLLNYRKLSEDERATLKELILGDAEANHPYLASDKELVAEFNLYAHLFPVKAKAYLPELYKELVDGRKEVVIKLGSQESKGLTQALKQANVTIEKGYGEEEEPYTVEDSNKEISDYTKKEYVKQKLASNPKGDVEEITKQAEREHRSAIELKVADGWGIYGANFKDYLDIWEKRDSLRKKYKEKEARASYASKLKSSSLETRRNEILENINDPSDDKAYKDRFYKEIDSLVNYLGFEKFKNTGVFTIFKNNKDDYLVFNNPKNFLDYPTMVAFDKKGKVLLEGSMHDFARVLSINEFGENHKGFSENDLKQIAGKIKELYGDVSKLNDIVRLYSKYSPKNINEFTYDHPRFGYDRTDIFKSEMSKAIPNLIKPSSLKFSKARSWDFKPMSDEMRQNLIDMGETDFVDRIDELENKVKTVADRAENHRLRLSHKDVLARIPELEKAAKKLKEGLITAYEYELLSEELLPMTPYEELPPISTEEEARYALANGKGQSEKKSAKYGLPMITFKNGEIVQLRLDIPSYSIHNKWVVSIHTPKSINGYNKQIQDLQNGTITPASDNSFKAGDSVGYQSVAIAKEVTFGMGEASALDIAEGSAKGTIATMMGKWEGTSIEEAKARAEEAMNSEEWVQVGMNPLKHSYFYDRDNLQPVIYADEVIQIGSLVLAKNPIYGRKSDFRFSQAQESTDVYHTDQSLKEGLTQAGDNAYGKGWTDRLLATGMFKIISALEANKIVGRGTMFHKAWHGSPHDYSKFDSSYMGTGEGAQAFGWGHYFTDAKQIAEWYKDTLSNKQISLLVDGVNATTLSTDYYGSEAKAVRILLDNLKYPNMATKEGLSEEQIKTIIDKTIDENMPRSGENDPNWLKNLESIRNYLSELKGKKLEIGKGKLYEVELAPTQEEYLDWNKPMSQQSDKVLESLKQWAEDSYPSYLSELEWKDKNFPNTIKGLEKLKSQTPIEWMQDLFNEPNYSGEDFYKELSEQVGYDEDASRYLNSMGIRGIRFKAEGGKSEDNNYVIFDDRDINIEAKYSMAGDIEAFFNPADGKTYFVAENIDKAADLHYLMMHEVGVHALNMGGNKEEFESILKQVDNLIKVKNPAALKGRQDALDADTPQEDLREETLAYLLKYAPKLKVVQQFKAWLKNALRNMSKMFPAAQRLGFIQWANKLSDQDLLYIANATLRKAPELLLKKSSEYEVAQAQEYFDRTGFMPYLSEGQLEIPVELAKFAIKTAAQAKHGFHANLGLPLNANKTVTLYYPTTNAIARKVMQDRKLIADSPNANRIYLTNQSAGYSVMENRGAITNEMDGAVVLIQIDPSLVQIDDSVPHKDGRRDFFIPIGEGEAFMKKPQMLKLFTLNQPRTKGIAETTTLAEVGERIAKAVEEYKTLTDREKATRYTRAKKILKRYHNITTFLTENAKLEKTRVGDYGLTYEGSSVASKGLGLASAQKINNKNLSTCPVSAICEELCLGETSGQNLLYGGKGAFRSGSRLSQYLKTEAMVLHPEEFAIAIAHEIKLYESWAEKPFEYVRDPTNARKVLRDAVTNDPVKIDKEIYQPAMRLNVTSDIPPTVFEPIMRAYPNVEFYDYTKLNSDSKLPNLHITYSSTGVSQIVDGVPIFNKHSNWRQSVQRLDTGFNVAMVFSDKNDMPKTVTDEATGKVYQVWNGDNYDARFLDPKRDDGIGMIVGLTNKDNTGGAEDATERTKGFFVNYNKKRDGDNVTILDQSKFNARAETYNGEKVTPSIKFSKSKKTKEGEIVNRSTGYTAYDKAKPILEEVDNKANYPEGVSLEEERDWLMQQLRRFDSFRKLNDKSNELINKYLTTMGRLPELGNYLGLRYQTLGKIDNVDDIVRNVFDTLQKATKEDSKEIYTYLTDNKATTEFILDPQMALMAKDLKEAITIIGKKLVEFNIIPMESFQMYEGRYLPRVYLEHIIQSSDRYQSLGSGKTLSPMGYAKRRDNNLPEEFRRLIKGEIKNTAYLASRTLSIPLRDIAMMEFFNQISDNEKWVWKQSLINIELDAKTNRPTAIFDDDGVINYNATNSALEGKPKKSIVRKVTPYFLDKEADRILDQSYSAPEEDRKDMQDLANMMKRAASQAMVNMDAVPADFMKMPNIAKYGSLRGLVVHKLIYDDLVGTINTYGAAGEQTALENFFGNNGVLAKVTSVFKFSHVAINIPTQVTNLLSNGLLLHMSGVRFDKVPVRVTQAFKEVLNEGENYKKMIAMGGRKATFSNQELSGITEWLLENEAEFSDKDMDWFSVVHIMRELSYLTGKTVRSANNLHQNIEMVFKVAKFIDMKAKGANDETAAVMAHQALFDYSFIPRWAKWLRTVPMGIPFITWTIKSFEATLRTAANRPTTFLPYYMLGYAMSLAAGADFGDDGEDKLKAILKLLPERMQRGGSVWILPIRDDAGRTQLIDMKNLFPWGKTAEAIDSLSKLVGNQDVAELRTLADSVGVFSSPITQAVVAINTNKDAFTGKQIVDENDPPAAKLQSILEYTYGMMSPPMLGGKGDIATLVKSQFPSQYEGIMNKDGSPKKTEQQAFIHLFTGLSIKSVDSEFDRRKKIDAFNNMITGIKSQRTRELRSNPNLSEESRRIVREKYDARIERVKEKKQKFKDETDVLK